MMTALSIDFSPVIDFTDEQFFELCQANRDLQIERTATGELIIMSPTGGDTSRSNADLIVDLGIWNRQTKLGIVFDSAGGFKLPNGAMRSPDAAWLRQERWEALTAAQQQRFLPLCPDFVIELMSPSDTLTATQAKMEEYRDNGAQLGWLINRADQQVEIYRPGQAIEVLQSPNTLSGESVLPGFVLNLQPIW